MARKQRPQPRRAVAPPAEEAGARERMIEGAARLLAQRGLQATSFSEVLAATGAPRGSVYHHFPDGKDQLIAAALDAAGAQLARALDVPDGASAEDVTALFVRIWRTVLTRSKLQAGCAVVAVAVAADSSALLERAAAVFRAWRARLAGLLAAGGLAPRDAAAFAATLIAACEGAVILGRAEQSLEPFELVAGQMIAQVRALARGERG